MWTGSLINVVPPKSLFGIRSEDRLPARTPPPTFLFLPIHLSKSPTGHPVVDVGRPPSHLDQIGCRRFEAAGLSPCVHADEALAEAIGFQVHGRESRGKSRCRLRQAPPSLRRYIGARSQNCQHRKIAFFTFFSRGGAPRPPATFMPHAAGLLADAGRHPPGGARSRLDSI